MKKVLVYVEDGYAQESLSLLEAVRQLYPDQHVETYALLINSDASAIDGVCDVLLTLEDGTLQPFDQKGLCDVFTSVHTRYSFDAILFLATPMGRCIAPSVSMRLETGLVADVTAIANDDGQISLIRPAYSGKIMAGIRIKGEGPVMMSIRIGVFTYQGTDTVQSTNIGLEGLDYRHGNIKVMGTKEKKIPYDIRESDVLISGGAGCSDMESLQDLADLLGGHVSASRAVVDKGIVPRAIQVGQSGKTVSPSLYIALGIHGALQHVEGLKDIPHIISVNTNKDAPICSISDIVVEGDALPFVAKLIRRIKEGQQR
ncbi:MAG: electron transfer flavoprotein subunit alpha/FixB family protein [Spirochaetia bacterium]|nr:electron transfer flavoprotein subunit alpha/FixB family protein [Spirochaetia bacterium]